MRLLPAGPLLPTVEEAEVSSIIEEANLADHLFPCLKWSYMESADKTLVYCSTCNSVFMAVPWGFINPKYKTDWKALAAKWDFLRYE
jgi:hypothetical protein